MMRRAPRRDQRLDLGRRALLDVALAEVPTRRRWSPREACSSVATDVTQVANDKGQLLPMIQKLQGLPKELGRAKRILATVYTGAESAP